MKKIYYLAIGLILITTQNFAQEDATNCIKTCTVKQVKHDGAFFGASIRNRCKEIGARLVAVIENTPAKKGGFQVDDRIMNVDGVEITNHVQFVKMIKAMEPYQKITVEYIRDNNTRTAIVELAAKNMRTVDVKVCCEDLESQVLIYPNPAAKEVTVQIENVLEGDYTFEIFNMLGAKQYIETFSDLEKNNSKKVNVSNLPEGSYILKITNGDQISKKMFIVSRN